MAPKGSLHGGPTLWIDTSHLDDQAVTPTIAAESPTPPPRDSSDLDLSARASSDARPPRRGSGELSPVSPNRKAVHSTKVPNELRKLLAHLLDQLQRRRRPLPETDALRSTATPAGGSRLGTAVGSMISIAQSKPTRPAAKSNIHDDDSDEEGSRDDDYTTDKTFDLIGQLNDVLAVSVSHGWHILSGENPSSDISAMGSTPKASATPSRLRRQSFQNARRRSRSPGAGEIKTTQLLSQCISVLSSVVAEDCRFQTSSPRPSRPPNALQSITLDFARFIVYAHSREPKVLADVGFALLPAFATFRPEMHSRLLGFFANSVVGNLLPILARMRGSTESISSPADRHHDPGPSEISIRVDAVDDYAGPSAPSVVGWSPWASSASAAGIESTNAPSQSAAIYHLSSLLSSMVAAILENLDLTAVPLATAHEFFRLFERIIEAKPDAYLDLLSVVSQHTGPAKRSALSLLMTWWPKAIGHLFDTSPLPTLTYPDLVIGKETHHRASTRQQHRHHPHAHQFVPWRFVPPSSSAVFDTFSRTTCRTCSTSINGFGLLCPFCMCATHFDCYDYPEGSFFSQYSLASDQTTQRVAILRFCGILPTTLNDGYNIKEAVQHSLSPVNMFTLTLCFACHLPLWGCTVQALKCSSCRNFVHPACISNPHISLPRCRSVTLNSTHMTIDWHTMRQSFLRHYSDMCCSSAELLQKSYEDVSVVYSVMWTQLQILENGMALGSVVVDNKEGNAAQEFELHRMIKECEDHLSSGNIRVSPTTREYLDENRLQPATHYGFFDMSYLAYVASVIKSPLELPNTHVDTSAQLLQVEPLSAPEATAPEESTHPFELIPLAHLRNALGYEFYVHSDSDARALLDHMHHVGLFERVDRSPTLFDSAATSHDTFCNFPLPLGLDLSADVATLFGAIESCLTDIDLSVNESGFLLLVRRLWPNKMTTSYATRRLLRMVVSWTLAEDDALAGILRDYVPQARSLPGLRSGFALQPWPSPPNSRSNATHSGKNGGDYIASRRVLLTRYVAPWMLALHDQDLGEYAHLVYAACNELSVEHSGYGGNDAVYNNASGSSPMAVEADGTLRRIVKLCQASVAFSAFDDLLHHWLQSISALGLEDQRMPSVQRMFHRDGIDSSLRMSSVMLSDADTSNTPAFDPWRVLSNIIGSDEVALARGVQWIGLLTRCGVDVPNNVYITVSNQLRSHRPSLIPYGTLVSALLRSAFLKSMGRQELQDVIVTLNVQAMSEVARTIRDTSPQEVSSSDSPVASAISFIRRSLAILLLLYGCERKGVLAQGIISSEDVQGLSRRAQNSRGSLRPQAIFVDPRLVEVLENYIDLATDEVTCLVAQFLKLSMNDPPLLDGLDDWISKNGDSLCRLAWGFYSVDTPAMATIRHSCLLRILFLESPRFRSLLHDTFQPNTHWSIRHDAVSRLFRIILDFASPEFYDEDQQWRSSVFDIFSYFFSAMWMDEREEVRLSVDTWSQTLLPAHLNAIASCWSETLLRAPVGEKLKVISFLIQLRVHFVQWQVVTWEVIHALLQDGGYNSMFNLSYTEPANLDSELQASIVLLSLQMISGGTRVDVKTIVLIKEALVRVLAFHDVSPPHFRGLESIPDCALPCVSELVQIVDAYRPFNVPPIIMGRPYSEGEVDSPLLVGSAFIDVVLALIVEVKEVVSLPFMATKSLLESFMIIIYKHDMESRALGHLQGQLRRALRKVLDVLNSSISLELRHLALSICQAFLSQSSTVNFAIVSDIILAVMKLLGAQDTNGGDVLEGQAKAFIERTLHLYGNSGVLNGLCKNALDRQFFEVLRQVTESSAKFSLGSSANLNLRDVLLKDTLRRAPENDMNSFQVVINNMQVFAEVHHGMYSPEMMKFIGSSLASIMRRTAEFGEAFNPNSLITMACTFAQFNQAQSHEILVPLDAILRAALPKLQLTSDTINVVFRTTSTIHRRIASLGPAYNGPLQTNFIVTTILDHMTDGLRARKGVVPATMVSILQACREFRDTITDYGARLLEDGVVYIAAERPDLYVAMALGEWILNWGDAYPEVFLRSMYPSGPERLPSNIYVRLWNILALVALEIDSSSSAAFLFSQLHVFSRAFNSMTNADAADIYQAHIAIILWMLLARKAGGYRFGHALQEATDDDDGHFVRLAWNELWPTFNRLILPSDVDLSAGSPLPLSLPARESLADVVSIVHQHRLLHLSDLCSQVSLVQTMHGDGVQGTTRNKILRALRSIFGPPVEVSTEVLMAELGFKIVAADKISRPERSAKESSVNGEVMTGRNRRQASAF